LVKQSSKDGTAKELVKKIQNRIIHQHNNEDSIKINVEMPDVTAKEIPYNIPTNWTWVRLGNVGSWSAGATPSRKVTKYYKNGDIPWVKTGDLNDGYLLDTPEKITKLALNNSSVRINPPGSVLMAMYGATIGKLCILKIPATTNQACCACIPYEGIYNLYLFYFLMGERKKFIFKGHGGAQPNISKDIIINSVISLPPYAEQKRIVEKLDEAFSLLAIIDKLQSKYDFNRKALRDKFIELAIRGMLTEQLSEDGTSENLYKQIKREKEDILFVRNGRVDKNIKELGKDVPFAIPPQWRWIRFGEVGLFKKGPFGSALTKSMFVPKSKNSVKVYEQQHAIQKDVNRGSYYISREYFENNMKGFEVLPGDIIISCAGTIGETFVMPDEMEQGIINQALMRVTLVDGIDKKFFQYYFDTNLKETAQDESNGSAIKNIPPFDVMKNWYFPLPPLAEQKRIVKKLDELLENV
jgi:type I restriction enzyme S subunit